MKKTSICGNIHCMVKVEEEVVEKIHETKPHFSEKQTKVAYDAYIAFKK